MMKKNIQRIRTYFASHFAASFVLVLSVAILSLFMLLQAYLKTEYMDYLVRNSYETQNALMHSVTKSINTSVAELIERGSEIAIDSELYRQVVTATKDRDNANVNMAQLIIMEKLKMQGYATDAISFAIGDKNGLIAQYDKNRTSDAIMWNDTNEDLICKMAEAHTESASSRVFSRIVSYTEPSRDPFLNKPMFHVVYPLTGGVQSIWKTEYILIISYSMKLFDEFLDTIEVPGVEYVQGYVENEEGKIIYHSDNARIGMSGEDEVSGGRVQLISGKLDYWNWTLNIVIDEEKMQQSIDWIYYQGVLRYLVFMVLLISIIYVSFRWLMRPVGILSESMKRVGKGNFHAKVQIEGEHEIWQIAEEYNRMIDAIRSKNKEIEKQHEITLLSVEQKHAAEKEALESQINAHFVCNTLGCINYEAIEAGNYAVSIMIKKLSNILRYTFDQKHQEVYIYQEIAWIDQYLFLQKSRLENVFEYEIDFPDVYGHWPCCKLMLQPFVENSILHGFEGRKQGGMIRVSGEMDQELLKIVIEDNGCGMSAETAAAIQTILGDRESRNLNMDTGTGIGIKNVVTRMRMFYGNRMNISMETQEGKGTTFVFRIPIPELSMNDHKE